MGILDCRGALAGRRAVLIGGAAGIGRAAALALGGAGVDIALCDIDDESIARTSAELRAMGRRVLGMQADATQPRQLAQFYSEAAHFFDGIDTLVNVVGGTCMQPFMDRSERDCADDIQRNFGYVIESMRHAVPLLQRSGRGGSIVNFTTIEAHRGAGGFAVYAGAKAATTNFSKAMAWELGPLGIRVNMIAPDTTPSAGNAAAIPEPWRSLNADAPPEWWAKAFQMYIPLQAPPVADDLANAVLFLASDLAKSITGQVLHVDGGAASALGMLRWPYDEGATLPVPMGGTLRKLFG
ncbi:SDR family NAD(P)-dependent oxidoreductase [Paraburkholderia diazotrophica]|uniref:NAD(P)-dependent dehydrogenase, short-chain alcohol dehydrogenase family n=1 Tax=Paraburkholderia diazotrophica TaxID=667676 RepID=A0A1H7CPV7_9BURK|nr:SDR family oxidoreductase [Paraburkholderia diazotrophica]SEJ89192.1 NAD(P)-dependent dehydrogenase, short-chain alcohol dehydrogenase family [Paraburkholderia diazotrophica]